MLCWVLAGGVAAGLVTAYGQSAAPTRDQRGAIRLEHHAPDHRLTAVLVGETARDLYLAAVGRGLVARPDHAAYLGCELGKAERALVRGERYVQDRRVERG